MTRPHNPYEDPAVRARHRVLLWRGVAHAMGSAFFVCLLLGGTVVLFTIVVDGLESSAFVDALLDTVYAMVVVAAFAAPIALVAGVIALVVLQPRLRLTGAAFGDEYCTTCGYALRDLAGDVCPECGREIDVPPA